ncbi:hypothetical protein CFP56_036458 [Quercus suber]|uniref:Uncharacterized protein n=1 Tax=Quercus suber TaxID=58331 RepID=A0AAW0J7I2_QUESU
MLTKHAKHQKEFLNITVEMMKFLLRKEKTILFALNVDAVKTT